MKLFKITRIATGIAAAFAPLAAVADPISLVGLAVGLAQSAGIITLGAVQLWGVGAALAAVSVWGSARAKRKAKKEAAYEKARFNAMLEDRATTVLSTVPPWRIIYGRAEVGCSVHAIFTKDKLGYRDNGTTYTRPDAIHYLVCVFAAHQCAAWHDLKIDNKTCGPFDANGWTLNSKYRIKDKTRVYRETYLAAGASIVESAPVILSTVSAYPDVYTGIDVDPPAAVSVTVSPDRLTVTNPQAFQVRVSYTLEPYPQTSLRVWFYDGNPDQAADATLMSLFPTKWTAAHRLRNRCYFVIMVDLEDPNFQSGMPSFTADLSGRLAYDPRTATTAFSQNNVVCIRDFLTSKWGAEAETEDIDDVLSAASANACDTSITIKKDGYNTVLGYEFVSAGGNEGWTTNSANLGGAGEFRTLTGTGEDPRMTRDSISVSGATARYVRVRIRRTGGSGWRGKVMYKTSLHGYSDLYRKDEPAGAAGDWVELTFDMHSLTAGAGDWKNSTITGIRLFFGLGTGDNFDIDWVHLSEFFEVTEVVPKYTLNGSFTTDQGREEILNEMALSMAGFVTNSGQWQIVAGAWTAPVMDIGDDDLDGELELVQADSGFDDLMNGGKGVYFKEGSAIATEFEPYQNMTLLAADGEPLWDETSFPFTNSETRARNLARIGVERSRSGQTINIPMMLHGWPLTVGDRVRVTNTEYGLTLKTYRITGWNFGLSSPVSLSAQEDIPETYDELDTTLSDPSPNTDMPDPSEVQKVEALTVSSGNAYLLRGTDGTIYARAFVEWSAAYDSYLVSGSAIIEIAWRRQFVDAPDTWRIVTQPATSTNTYLDGVRENDLIVVRARYRNNVGVYGDAVFVVHTVLGKTEAPSNVTGLNAVMVEGGVQFSWSPCPEADYLETEIRYGASWAAGTKIFAGSADSAFWPRPALGTYTIWAKHRDTSLIESVTAASGTIEVLAGSGPGSIVWTSVTGRPALYRLTSVGYACYTAGLFPLFTGFYNAENNVLQISSAPRGYNVVKIDRATGIAYSVGAYDIYALGIVAANEMAAALNALGPTYIVCIFTNDEPHNWRFEGNLPPAMYRCGASRGVWGSPEFKGNAAYVLVGIPDCGEGQGYEAYQGAIDGDPHAWCDVTMQVLNGNFIITGSGGTPRTLRDYSYTGDYDATKDSVLFCSAGIQLNGNRAIRTSAYTGAWDEQVYSAHGFTNGAVASARLLRNASEVVLMFGLNEDPYADSGYLGLDYAVYPTGGGIYLYASGVPTYISTAPGMAGDIFTVKYDGYRIQCMHNGINIGSPVIAGLNRLFFFDSSMPHLGAGIDQIRFVPVSGVNEVSHNQLTAAVAADLAAALATAAAAQATADGKIDSFWQTTPPGTASEGDLWFDTDDSFKQYRWTSGGWVLAADTRIGTAISSAATAQATADGKVTSFFQTSAPTALGLGDLWFDSDDGYKLYRWNGSSWVAGLFDSTALALEAATKVSTTTVAGPVGLSSGLSIPDNQDTITTISVGPYAIDTRIRASATFMARVTAPGGGSTKGNSVRMRICDLNTQVAGNPPMQIFGQAPKDAVALDGSGSIIYEKILSAGVTAVMSVGGANGNFVSPYGSSEILNMLFTVEVIKR